MSWTEVDPAPGGAWTVAPQEWIMLRGFWNDRGVWDDTAVWVDSGPQWESVATGTENDWTEILDA